MKKIFRIETSFVVELEEEEIKKFLHDLNELENNQVDDERILTASRVTEIPREMLSEYVEEIKKLFPAKANQVLASHFSVRKDVC